jgi:hypothetical protein
MLTSSWTINLHLVVSGPKLADTIRDFKSYTAKRLLARFNQMEGSRGTPGKPPPLRGGGLGEGGKILIRRTEMISPSPPQPSPLKGEGDFLRLSWT